ncbi:MAG: AEC family transporter [Gallionella sp.]|nr:AEC family transporter [Gallionella sp.]
MIFLHILEIVFPLVAVVSVGVWAGRRHRPEMDVANQLNMDYFLPALVLGVLVKGDFHISEFARLGLGTFLLVAASGLAGLITARLSRTSPKTIVPSMMFNNCGNLGLPLAVLAFGEDAMPAAVVMFLVSNMLHFSFGAWFLNHKARLRDLWKVPVLLATVVGLGLNLAELHMWAPLMTAIRMLGEVSIPLMMFALGVRLAQMTLAEFHLGLLIAVVRPVAGIALAYAVGWSLNLTGIQHAQLIVFGALPPAVLNYMFAERYSQEPEKVASMVLIGNVAALVFIPLALMFVLK